MSYLDLTKQITNIHITHNHESLSVKVMRRKMRYILCLIKEFSLALSTHRCSLGSTFVRIGKFLGLGKSDFAPPHLEDYRIHNSIWIGKPMFK